jgi:hypothetical protein
MKTVIAALALILLAAGPTFAASPSAWQLHEGRARRLRRVVPGRRHKPRKSDLRLLDGLRPWRHRAGARSNAARGTTAG